MSARARETLTRYFGKCDIQVEGPRPTDIQIRDPRFFQRVLDRRMICFEHVGPKNCRQYLQVVRRCLKPSGSFLQHTIGSGRWHSNVDIDPWLARCLIPNAVVPGFPARNADVRQVLLSAN